MQRLTKVAITAVVVVALAGAGAWYWRVRHPVKSLFRTTTVKRGDLSATITATGTVEPEEVVDVGAQVAGQLLSFGRDANGKPIDYGSIVESNMVLANIDGVLYKADVALDEAAMKQDKAGETRAAADLEQMKAKEVEAEADWKRAQVLGPSEALAPTTYDSYKANYEIAKANVDLDVAALAQAQATTVQAEATLEKAQRTLDYCTIRSPVKGVIIDRRVNIGETVVSSLNTPSLFLVAKDLTAIQVWVSVNEADVGSIYTNQPVTFTVDAFPNRTFHGKVNKVRLNATMTQNVVTYTVEVDTQNLDGKLLPYLTANVRFLTGRRKNVLLASNSALRWHPEKASEIAPEFRQPAPAESGEAPRGGGRRDADGGDGAPPQNGMLWAQEGNFVRPIAVKLGLTDGISTEVQGEGLEENTVVVVGLASADDAAPESPGANPFIPQFGRRGGARGGRRGP